MRMPDLGTVDDTIKVVKWLAEVGQPIGRGQPLLEVETDKSIMELESPVTGTLAGDQRLRGRRGGGRPGDRDVRRRRRTQPERSRAATANERRCGRRRRSRRHAPRTRPRPVTTAVATRTRSSNGTARPASESTPPRRSPADYSRDFLLDLYQRMVLIREFEEGVKFLFLEGAMPGTIHQCQGQEATAVGVCAALEESDFITSTFRGHGHALAKGLTPESCSSSSSAPAPAAAEARGVRCTWATWTRGWCRASPSSAAASRSPRAWRLALKMQKSPAIVACFFGDGAVAEGAFHEGVNLAAIWDLPVALRLREQPVRCVDAGRPGDAEPPNRRPRRRLRHQGRNGRRQRRAGRLRGGPAGGRRLPARPGAGLARALDLSPHRPLPARRLPLSGQGRTRGLVRPRPDRAAGPAS